MLGTAIVNKFYNLILGVVPESWKYSQQAYTTEVSDIDTTDG